MIKKSCVFILTFIIFLNLTTIAFSKSDEPKIDSDSALMIDLATDRYLYSKNETQKINPGGLVKIMTAIVAIEHISDKNATVTADVNTLSSYDYSFGHMGILANEKLSYDNLLNGMLLYDAGDAAEVIASNVMSSREAFIKEMNKKAVEIGALNTKFTNPTGFPDENQYSTAEDLFKITKYAMSNSYFKEIVGKSRYEMGPTNKYVEYRYLDNKNKFMNVSTTDKYFTSKVKGIKTSYIDDDDCSLILQYENDNIQLMTICIGAHYDGTLNYSYEDSQELLDYGLNYYTNVKVISEGDIFAEVELTNGKDIDRLLLDSKEDIYINLPKNYDPEKITTNVNLKKDISAPINKGDLLGTVDVLYDNEKYISFNLTAPNNIEADNIKGFFTSVWAFISSPTLLVAMGILLIIVVWSLLIFNRKKVYKIDNKK